MKQKALFVFALLCAVAQGAWAAPINLSTVNADVTAQDGDVLTGTTSEYRVTIADGATVTLSGVTISTGAANSHCIQCAGTATIILAEGTTNTLTCTQNFSPALRAGGTGTTLTIQGTGTLKAQSGWRSAGIGGFYDSGGSGDCGNIVIEGGTIEAKGGGGSAGIGSAYDRSCGNITIASSVKCVSAISGKESATHCIGKGDAGSCGTVTIGGVVYWNGSAYQNDGADYIGQNELNVAFINNGAVNVPTGKYYHIIGTKVVTGHKITIGNDATVALSNVNISNGDPRSYCIKCEGSATIILKDGTTNELTSKDIDAHALWVGGDGTKLTIKGELLNTGTLIAEGGSWCAAIGGGRHNTYSETCGDIEIQGGIITATGGRNSPGIGCDYDSRARCGNITITSGVKHVTAIGGDEATDCIGKNYLGSCGTVTIGDMVFYDGSAYKNRGANYFGRSELSVASINSGSVDVNDGEFCLIFGNGNATNNRFRLIGSSTAVLSNVYIETVGWAVNCYNNNTSTIILKDGTMNKLISTGTYDPVYLADPALWIGDAGTTLIIKGEGDSGVGTGKLFAQGGYGCAAIGGGYYNNLKTCGNIQILGGIIEAKGGDNAPAIGADNGCACGDITISNNVTCLIAKKGSGATDCIGRGNGSSCGTVTIGGVVYYNGSDYQNNGSDYIGKDALAYLKTNKGNSSDYWTTFYYGDSHFQAAEGTQVFKAGLSGETLTITSISDRIVNANRAVILKGNSPNIFLTSSDSGTTSEGGYDGNQLEGRDIPQTNISPGKIYVLNNGSQGVGFYKLKSTGIIGANKAYLNPPIYSAREYFLFDEETTALNEVRGQKEDEGGLIYDLQGRRVVKPTKGLYIVNGKKVSMK